MEARLAAAAGGPVSVKATRPERLGALGRGEGVACLAVALILPVDDRS
jgi:2C-methyl-D-erythritol 2,4-cyclodiphosphate synthase